MNDASSITRCIAFLCRSRKKVIYMLSDYTVNITYKNRSLESVGQTVYSFSDYCQEQKLNLMHVITDVENAFYSLQCDKNKDEWDTEVLETFQRIRHKLLDSANNIVRLPQNLRCNGVSVSATNCADYIADVVNQYTK